MTDIRGIERALSERLDEVEAQMEALEQERDCLQRALRALRGESEGRPALACPGARGARPHPAPWQRDRLRR